MSNIIVAISDEILRQSEADGSQAFLDVITDTISTSCGNELNADALVKLSAQQISLWAWRILRTEVDQGGFIQLIHNGWGGFFFQNPFAKIMKIWGLRDLSKMLYDVSSLYKRYAKELEKEMTEDEFMALYEQYPEFDEFDDDFVEHNDKNADLIANYVNEHLGDFVTII